MHHARQIGLALDLGDHRGGARSSTRIGRADALGQALCVQVLPLPHRVQAQYLAPSPWVGLVAVPQRQLLTVVFQQQLVAAGKGVGKREAVCHQGLRLVSGKTGEPMGGSPGLLLGVASIWTLRICS